MKQCPHCQYQTLHETSYRQQRIDVCPACGGFWFEADEFNQAIAFDREHPVPDNTDVESHTSKDSVATDMLCPECQSPMNRHWLLDNYRISVERCPNGHGMWIERKELKQALASGHLLHPFMRLNKKVSWRSWLFQLLTQMPVEYNLKPRHFPMVTLTLVLLNTLLFLAGQFDPHLGLGLLETGAMIPAEVTHGQRLPTLITNLFLHSGWMHLIGNMYFLWLVGDNLEDVLGKLRFLLLYLFCGVMAALSQAFSDPDGHVAVIGASGAIAGLFGMYLLWFRRASLTYMLFIFQKKVSPWVFFLIWLGLNIYGMYRGGHGVAYMAHIGGFVSGIVLGLGLRSWVRENNPILQLLQSKAVQIKR